MEWMTQAEFARKEGVSRMAVCKAIRAGRLKTNGKPGKACRVHSACSLADSRTQRFDEPRKPKSPELHPDPNIEESPAPQMSVYQAVRTKKLLADIEAQNYRNEAKYNAMLKQLSEKMFELYSVSFAPVKDRLINLNLNAEQYASLRSIIEKARDDFRKAISEWNASL